MSVKRIFVFSMSFLLLGLVAPAILAQTRVAFVDLQRALNETSEGQQAKARLKRMFDKRQGELDSMQEKLKTMEEDLKRQKSVLSEKAYEQRVESYRKSFVELQTTYVQYQRDLSEKEAEETGRIFKRMQDILGEIGERENFDMVVEVNEGGVFYYRKSLDLTNELIRLYDQRHPIKGGGGGAKTKGGAKAKGGGKAPPPSD